MPVTKLTYFPIRGVAEPIRFLLKYGDIEFEDLRISKAVWPEYKDKTPFAQVPILEVDGKVAYQSVAICRYLGKKVKLVGDNDWEDLEIDAIVDTINDFRSKVMGYHYEENQMIKELKKGPLFDESVPFYLERLEAVVKANSGHLAVNKLTWADFFFVANVDYLNAMTQRDLFIGFPNLQRAIDTVRSIPAIKKWIEERPVTET